MHTIPKKNSQQIFINKRTGRPFISQSKRYLEFEKNCEMFLYQHKYQLDQPINLKCTFYVPDRRVRDLTNLLNSIQDVLVRYRVLMDDNYNVVRSVDGSRIIYEKGKEFTIVEIEETKE